MAERRDRIMFFAGSIPRTLEDDFTGRGGAFIYYSNDTERYLIAAKGQGKHIKFADAMRSSDFCFSPLGTSGGDTGK